MTQRRWLILGGLVAFLFGMLAGIPAQTGLKLLGVTAAQSSGVTGSIWHGEARAIEMRGLRLSQIHWTLSPLGLLAGRLSGEARTDFTGGRASGVFVAGVTGAAGCRDCVIQGSMEGLRGFLPLRDLGGDFNVHFDSFEWRKGWVRRAVGTADVQNMPVTLSGQGAMPGVTGSYSAKFAANPVPDNGNFEAEVRDTGGPLKVEAKVRFSPPGNYDFAGKLTPKPGAPAPLVNGVQMLGQRTPDGAYSVSFSGSF
jgi:general secretion pathway protein N